MKSCTREINAVANEIEKGVRKLPNLETETVRNLRRQFSQQIAEAEAEFVVGLALKVLRLPLVPRFFAYELIQFHAAARASLKVKLLEELASGNQTWGTVDAFACYLAGPAWREGRISDSAVQRWARSPDRWWRRTAVVSTVPLNNKARGGSGDARKTLMICEMLAGDRDDMVVKAVSWALRALSQRDPESVRKFLKKHQGSLAPRITREVNSKLETGLKNPRR